MKILIEKNQFVFMRDGVLLATDLYRNAAGAAPVLVTRLPYNTGGNVATEGRDQYQAAVNRSYHDADHPSHILLPIIERA